MRLKSLLSIFILVLILNFVWTSSYALAASNHESKIYNKLREKYPDADIRVANYSEIPEEIKQKGETRYIVLNSNEEAEKLSAELLISSAEVILSRDVLKKYPSLLFSSFRFRDYKKSEKFFMDNSLLMLIPDDEVFTGKEKKLEPLDIIKKNPDGSFRVLEIKSKRMFDLLSIELKDRIVLVAEVSDTSRTDIRNGTEVSSSPEIDLAGSCTGELPDLGDDGAVVLFVIVGLFVVAVFVIYAGKFVYDAISGTKRRDGTRVSRDIFFEMSPQVTFYEKERSDGFNERGSMAGLKLISGFEDRSIHVGLALEAGWMDVDLYSENERDNLDLDGYYGMIGPVIRFPVYGISSYSNPSAFSLEFIAGAHENDKAGFLSAAKVGFNVGIGEHMRIGFNMGSLYFDLDDNDGVAKEDSDFRFTLGMDIGYRF